MPQKQALFRFYQELNDFLPQQQRKCSFPYLFWGTPAIKDAIEALGVPHTEVDLILVNSQSVPFTYQLQHGDQVSVYPMFESLDISPVTRLRPKPLRDPKFILDVHLGKLARNMRMLGFDAAYDTSYDDPTIIHIALHQQRTILTRDIGILKHNSVTHGYWVRSQQPLQQTTEIIERFDLRHQIVPFSRCISCNGLLEPVEKADIQEQLQPRTRAHYHEFYRCRACRKIYWKGSHYQHMLHTINQLTDKKLTIN